MTEATALTDHELDAYLAEHLFRHRMIDAAEAARVSLERYIARFGSEFNYEGYYHPEVLYEDDGYFWLEPAPSYSSTGDGMLLVIEAMRERGYGVVVSALSTGEFHVLIAKDADIDWLTDDYAHESASLPRAVAEAAAAAIQAEEAGA